MTDLLLELFSEEIPARMQSTALTQLITLLRAGLQDARLSFHDVSGFVTPRRLAVLVRGLPSHQPDQNIERKGPKTSAPDIAIEGFCTSVGLSRDMLDKRVVGKDEIYFAVSEQKGQSTLNALPDIVNIILRDFHWTKSMRSGSHETYWVRPLRAIMCLFGDAVVPVSWGHVTSGNQTFGHRFMAGEAMTISIPDAYEAALEKAYVIADADKRKAMIVAQTYDVAAREGFTVRPDEGLLNEVTGLVEYPVALMGVFDASYLRLPPEVLVLEMRHHQKYFAVLDASGAVTNRFITVANLVAKDGGKQIVAGNERVLRARLEDGAFYYEQDSKKSLDAWAEGLSSMLFHKSLGSVADKVRRIEMLAVYFAGNIGGVDGMRIADEVKTRRAALLCKADLTTGMVGEFPELQGVMGRYYALAAGEDAAVADAIRDHYKPAGQSDDVPVGSVAIMVSLADKFDTLVGLFAAGEIPTGSKDPYALRRAALGILRVIRGHSLRLSLLGAIDNAMIPFVERLNVVKHDTAAKVFAFMMERLKVSLKEEGFRYDVLDAVVSVDQGGDVVKIVRLGQALQSFLDTEDGTNVLAAYKRTSNILKKEEARDGMTYHGMTFSSYCDRIKGTSYDGTGEEGRLLIAVDNVRDMLYITLLEQENYTDVMTQLATLRQPLDAFFEHVMVNADDAAVRVNRLLILGAFRSVLHQVADFSCIEG